MASQKLLAERVNVSTATVSRVMRNDGSVDPRTRARVLAMADEMGFKPRAYRQSRRNGDRKAEKAQSVGVVMTRDPGRHDTYAGDVREQILIGLTDAASRVGLRVFVNSVSVEDQQDGSCELEQAIDGLRETGVLGQILLFPFSREFVQRLCEQVNCVTINHQYPGVRIDTIMSSQSDGIARLTERLYELGHRRIGFIASRSNSLLHYPRLAGYLEAHARLGLEVDPQILINGLQASSLTLEQQLDHVCAMIESGVRAWVCAKDRTALSWMEMLSKRGFEVPRDVSITGYDAVPLPTSPVSLTTMRPNYLEMGVEAIERLRHRSRYPTAPPVQISYVPQFVEGESAAPPAGGG